MKVRLGKILGIIAVVMMAVVVATPAMAAKPKAQIGFEKVSHNFGTIKQKGGVVSVDFDFVNAGNAPLVIYDATADCGCTKPEYPDNPIMPGKTGTIHVTFNPVAFNGGFSKNVKVKSNATRKTVVLKISGQVER